MSPGEHTIDAGADGCDAFVYVPDRMPERGHPLVLCLHGAGSEAAHRIEAFRPYAARCGVALLGVDALDQSWDMIVDSFGPDIERIQRALDATFDRWNIDPERVAIEGFSDGGSYALALGLANGDFFRWIFAFSPGFVAPPEAFGHPHIFITHGIRDATLPVACSRALIVPQLRQAGYDVEYKEFRGVHTVPKWALEACIETVALL